MNKEYLNILFAVRREHFGTSYEAVKSFAKDTITDLSEKDIDNLCEYIEKTYKNIIDYLYENYKYIDSGDIKESEVKNSIIKDYAWMNEENAASIFAQGMYYGWRG